MCGYAVDWLRSSYTSFWKLFRDGDIRTRKGFYYFSPPGTPFYDGVHPFGSPTWTTDDNPSTPVVLGEVGPRAWYNGERPPHLPAARRIGSAECIERGAETHLELQAIGRLNCGRPLPPGCYDRIGGPGREDVYDCRDQWHFMYLPTLAYTNPPSGFRPPTQAELAGSMFFGEGTQALHLPSSNDDKFPAILICARGDDRFVFISGTTNGTQLIAQALGFASGPVTFASYGTARLYEDAATRVLTQLTDAFGEFSGQLLLAGHSYGGAVAMVAAAKVRLNDANRKLQIFTFGAPHAGSQRLYDVIKDLHQYHIANDGDPIPFLPPRFLPQSLLDIVGPAWLNIWDQWRRPRVLAVIDAAGVRTRTYNDAIPDDVVETAMVAIKNGDPLAEGSFHNTTVYLDRAKLSCPTVEVPPAWYWFQGIALVGCSVTDGTTIYEVQGGGSLTFREGVYEHTSGWPDVGFLYRLLRPTRNPCGDIVGCEVSIDAFRVGDFAINPQFTFKRSYPEFEWWKEQRDYQPLTLPDGWTWATFGHIHYFEAIT